MLVEQRAAAVGVELLGQGGEADDVGEQHRDLELARGHRVGRGVVHELAHQPARHVGLEPGEAVAHGVEGARGAVELADVAARQSGTSSSSRAWMCWAASASCSTGRAIRRPSQKVAAIARTRQPTLSQSAATGGGPRRRRCWPAGRCRRPRAGRRSPRSRGRRRPSPARRPRPAGPRRAVRSPSTSSGSSARPTSPPAPDRRPRPAAAGGWSGRPGRVQPRHGHDRVVALQHEDRLADRGRDLVDVRTIVSR